MRIGSCYEAWLMYLCGGQSRDQHRNRISPAPIASVPHQPHQSRANRISPATNIATASVPRPTSQPHQSRTNRISPAPIASVPHQSHQSRANRISPAPIASVPRPIAHPSIHHMNLHFNTSACILSSFLILQTLQTRDIQDK